MEGNVDPDVRGARRQLETAAGVFLDLGEEEFANTLAIAMSLPELPLHPCFDQGGLLEWLQEGTNS